MNAKNYKVIENKFLKMAYCEGRKGARGVSAESEVTYGPLKLLTKNEKCYYDIVYFKEVYLRRRLRQTRL